MSCILASRTQFEAVTVAHLDGSSPKCLWSVVSDALEVWSHTDWTGFPGHPVVRIGSLHKFPMDFDRRSLVIAFSAPRKNTFSTSILGIIWTG